MKVKHGVGKRLTKANVMGGAIFAGILLIFLNTLHICFCCFCVCFIFCFSCLPLFLGVFVLLLVVVLLLFPLPVAFMGGGVVPSPTPFHRPHVSC